MMDINEAREMLRHIPCSALDYQDWTNVGAALHKEGLPCSRWDEGSSSDPTRYHTGECEKKWRTFGNYAGTEVTMGTVYHMAVEYGWDPVAGKKTYGWDDVIGGGDLTVVDNPDQRVAEGRHKTDGAAAHEGRLQPGQGGQRLHQRPV